jgi:hypothetical protein
VKITTPITRKLQEKFSLMAAVSDGKGNMEGSGGSLAGSFSLEAAF